jgi:hypothetical protein
MKVIRDSEMPNRAATAGERVAASKMGTRI